MKKKRLLSILFAASIVLSGCSNPFYEEKLTKEEKEQKQLDDLLTTDASGSSLDIDNENEEIELDENGEPIVYDIKIYTLDELKSDQYYVKHGENYYEIPFMASSFSGFERTVPYILPEKNAEPGGDPSRYIMYEKNKTELQIPTLYADDLIVYKSDYEVNQTIEWERFLDGGYTIGICGMTENNLGTLSFNNFACNITKHSALAVHYNRVYSDDEDEFKILNLDTINGVKMTSENLSESGYIKNLPADENLEVNIYQGTELFKITTTADARVFYNFENYWTRNISYNEDGFVALEVPKFFKSGYYKVNDSGMFRYIAEKSNENIDLSKIKYNKAFFKKDETGELVYKKDEENHFIYEDEDISDKGLQSTIKPDNNNFTE